MSTSKGGKRALYDSYIRAFKWATERIGENGIIAFVSGAGWIDRSFADGMRKSLSDEFSKIYVVNLRGDIRKNMLSGGRAKEGENIFGQASMTGITITILVKSGASKNKKIFYFDIGSDLSRESKLVKLANFGSIKKMMISSEYDEVIPDQNNNWINQGSEVFKDLNPLYEKNKPGQYKSIFKMTSYGVVTNRDAWCLNFSKKHLISNTRKMVNFYNSEVERYQKSGRNEDVNKFVNPDPKMISWGTNMKVGVKNCNYREHNEELIEETLYRPFTKSNLYRD